MYELKASFVRDRRTTRNWVWHGMVLINLHSKFYWLLYTVFAGRTAGYITNLLTPPPLTFIPVASLGWVTHPGRQLRVSPLYFFPEKPGDLFCSSPSLSLSLFIASARVSPYRGCHPTPFLPVRPRFSTILCKFAYKFFPSGVTPWRVSPGAVRPHPLVTPLTFLLAQPPATAS